MGDRRTIYVIEAGSYSDYGVLFAYDNEADAQACVQAGTGTSYTEMHIWPAGEIPTIVVIHTVTAVLHRHTGWLLTWQWRGSKKESDWYHDPRLRGGRAVLSESEVPLEVRLTATCHSEDLAVKAITDRAAQIRAERLGL